MPSLAATRTAHKGTQATQSSVRAALKAQHNCSRRTQNCPSPVSITVLPPLGGGGGGSFTENPNPSALHTGTNRGCRNEKKKLGVSNTPYDGGRWITDGGWWITDGGWCVTDGGWCVTDGGWCVTDGSWWVTDGGWWVATKHQRVDAIVKKKRGERPYGTPWAQSGACAARKRPLFQTPVPFASFSFMGRRMAPRRALGPGPSVDRQLPPRDCGRGTPVAQRPEAVPDMKMSQCAGAN